MSLIRAVYKIERRKRIIHTFKKISIIISIAIMYTRTTLLIKVILKSISNY